MTHPSLNSLPPWTTRADTSCRCACARAPPPSTAPGASPWHHRTPHILPRPAGWLVDTTSNGLSISTPLARACWTWSSRRRRRRPPPHKAGPAISHGPGPARPVRWGASRRASPSFRRRPFYIPTSDARPPLLSSPPFPPFRQHPPRELEHRHGARQLKPEGSIPFILFVVSARPPKRSQDLWRHDLLLWGQIVRY